MMKFIKQHKTATDVINLGFCKNFYTSEEKNNKIKFVITFVMGDPGIDQEYWRYEKESERDLQFKYICEFVGVQSIGN